MNDLSSEQIALLNSLLEEDGVQLPGEDGIRCHEPIARRPDPDRAPLSWSQIRLWFLDQLEPGTAVYNLPVAVWIRSEIIPALLEGALQAIVARHETLRTHFAQQQGEPVQIISREIVFALPVADLRHLSSETRQAEAERLAIELLRTPFCLETGPLIRAGLFQVTAQSSLLAISMHHIVSDGWSIGVLLDELSACYQALLDGKDSVSLTPLPIQYGDFSYWQSESDGNRRIESELAYWKRQLAGPLPVLELQTDRPRPPVQTFKGAGEPTAIAGALTERIRDFCRREGVTPFMFLMSVFAMLLYRYSGQEDILIGTPVAGRTRSETEGLIGFFLNTLVLRIDASDRPTFRQLLRRVRETALDGYANQSVPFETLVEELKPPRDMSRSPLFQVMFILQAPISSPGNARALPMEFATLEQGTAKYDLTLFLNETGDSFSGYFEFNTDLFDTATIHAWVRHFEQLTAAALDAPGARIAELPIFSPSDRKIAILDWNRAQADQVPRLLTHHAIERQAKRRPAALAVSFGGTDLTYGQLDRVTNQLARRLQALGVGPDVLVGLALERSVQMVIAAIAVFKAGGAYVPLDPEFPSERLAFMLEDSEAHLLITDQHLLDRFPGYRGNVVCLDADQQAILQESAAAVETSVTPDHLAYVIFTSGSTGKPKGVMVTHRALSNFLDSMRREPGFTPRDVLLAVTTLSFDIAGLELFLPLTSGGRVAIASRETTMDGRAIAREIERVGANMMQATPATWQLMIESGWQGNRQLTALCGGEALSRELADGLIARAGDVWNMYGPTETTIWSLVWRVEGQSKPIRIGKAICNTNVYILDQHGQPAPIGAAGELYLGGEGLARGYLKRPDLTAAKFIRNPLPECAGERIYQTGDFARFASDGTIECLGRADQQVKIRGFRIELGEIESALRQQPGIFEAVVVARPDPMGQKRLCAYFVQEAGLAPSIDSTRVDAIRRGLRERLPEYMVPSAFTLLDAFPKTANGKIDRKALPDPGAPEPASRSRYVAARDELEAQLVRIWSEVLEIPEPGVYDDFFDLGGHSLLAARLFAAIEKSTGHHIPLATLFRSPTIEALARSIRGNDWDSGWSPVVELQRGNAATPFFCIHSLGANLVSYKRLSMMLGDDQQFYGLQPHGLDGREEPHTNLMEMAAAYLREVRRIQPHGPYYLGGVCLGGVVAYEMAQQLTALGEDTAFLLMIDSEYPATPEHQHVRSYPLFLADWHLGELLRLSSRQRIAYISSKIGNARTRIASAFHAPDEESSLARAVQRIRKANLQALLDYVPAPYEGTVTMFWSGEAAARCYEDRRLAWSSVVRGGFDVHVIPGNHLSMIEPPHVEVMAAKLRACLAKTYQRTSPTEHRKTAATSK